MTIKLILCAGIVLLAGAQDKPVAPAITVEMRAKFWRAQAENLTAQAQAQKTAAAFQQTVTDMRTLCGTAYDLTVAQDGEPACLPKPEQKAP